MRSREAVAARVELEYVWQQLAPIIEECSRLKSEAIQNPGRLSDPWVKASFDYLMIFGRQLDAVRTIYEARKPLSLLRDAHALQVGANVGRKLVDIAERARQKVSEPSVPSVS